MPKPKFQIQPVIVTTLTALLCSLLLAGAYMYFEEDIKANAKAARQEAIFDVIPGAKKLEEKEKGELTYYVGKRADGSVAGYALPCQSDGYSDKNKLMVGYTPDKTRITKIAVVAHSETPGLGAEMEKDYFKEQFEGKSVNTTFEVVKLPSDDKGAIDALSGATITTASVVSAVNEANYNLKELFEKESGYGYGLHKHHHDDPDHVCTNDHSHGHAHHEHEDDEVNYEHECRKVYQDAVKYEEGEVDGMKYFKAINNSGEAYGCMIATSHPGFKGEIKLMIGYDLKSKTISKFSIIDQKETPTYGGRMHQLKFREQFKGLNAMKGVELGKDLDAISGATVSSVAIAKAVTKANAAFRKIVDKEGEVNGKR